MDVIRCIPTPLARVGEPIGDALGFGVRCVPRAGLGHQVVDYFIGEGLVATAFLDEQSGVGRVDVVAASALSKFEIGRLMYVLSLACSRAEQLSYAMNLKRPAGVVL